MQTMNEAKDSLEKLLSKLRSDREELRLQMHLASRELQQEWSQLEDKWMEIDDRLRPTKQAVAKTARDVWESIKLVGEEIEHGYRRIRESLAK